MSEEQDKEQGEEVNFDVDFEVNFQADFEAMGYELAGVIEFYENANTGKGGYRAMIFDTTAEENLPEGKDMTDAQKMVAVTQKLLEGYLTQERH